MKKVFLIAIAVIMGLGTIYAQQNNTIETSVNVKKEVIPDEIFISITINEKDNKGKISVEEQQKQMIKALSSLGIDTKAALTVDNMGSTLKQNTLRKDNIFISKRYTLKVSTAKDASAAIQALKEIDMAQTYVSRVAISDSLEREVKNQLLVEAAQKAQENAKILASAVGCKAGKAVYIQNYYSFDSSAGSRMLTVAYKAVKDNASEITEESAQELEVTKKSLNITVNCKFLLE
ncbi:MAG: SIMPL domain-containing protein [Bacteroidales bacterium]|nr:SIMPL domain-containing protein [Bacteroidales bacterium]